MTIAAPIRNQEGKVIAALAVRLDPRRDFTQTIELARLEATGETYAFDRDGRLLTQSRFEANLRDSGMLPPGGDSILNTEIRDPGGNTVRGYRPNVARNQQPLTRMAASAVKGQSGVDLQGYRDYRGVPVVGAWLWDGQLSMGLATEMDFSEAFASYYRVRNLAVSLLGLMFAASTLLLLLLRHRDRLIAASRAHSEAVRARDEVMAMVAHDLRNPLNAMILRSHLLLQTAERCSGSESSDIARNLKLLQRTAHHLSELIGRLTDAARIDAGRLYLSRQEYTLQDALEPAIERTFLLARDKGIDCSAEVPSEALRVSIDQSRITQALDNLLGNALKFTAPGGKITVQLRTLEDVVRISVADTGSGIPEEGLSRIFEPYWQANRGRAGMGLGLFIAKTIIEAHGGKLWVESRVGQGTTFYFTLPLIGTAGGNAKAVA